MTENGINRRVAVGGLAAATVAGAVASTRGLTGSVGTQRRTDGKQYGVELSLADFGVSPKSTPQENLARFKVAVASAPADATLRLQPTGTLACVIDTSGGWSAAVEIDRPITLQIDGNLKATHSAVRPNPPFILNITSPGVTISGSGRIIGDGAIDDTNAGTDETIPGLVRVAADDFTMTGVEIVAPPKVGVMLYQCQRARIHGVRFSGGPKVYGDTGHFGVRAAGGGHHIFDRNRFYPTADGGMVVQCIMLAGSHDNVMTTNYALHPYEKLIYAYGDRNLARDNVVIGNPNFIPGTNIQGTITGVFRFHGSFNRVESNYTRDCAGGVQMMDGTAHAVINNQFLACGQSAIVAYQSDLSGSTFRGNIGTRAALTGFVAGDGMRLISDKGAARNVVVADNRVSGFSVADPIAALAPWSRRKPFGRNSVVKPTTGNGRFYTAQAGGVSAAHEPEWPTTPGETVMDGTIVWVTLAYEAGQAEIKLNGMSAGAPVTNSTILNNITRGGQHGIVVLFVTHSHIARNEIDALKWGLIEDAGRHNKWESNIVRGTANKQVRGLAATSAVIN